MFFELRLGLKFFFEVEFLLFLIDMEVEMIEDREILIIIQFIGDACGIKI